MLSQAITLSMSSRLNKLAEMDETSKLVNSGTKTRLSIPPQLVSSSSVTVQLESHNFSDVGKAMLISGPGDKEDTEHSFPSTLAECSTVTSQMPPLPPKMGRTLKQIAKEDSMASASVWVSLLLLAVG